MRPEWRRAIAGALASMTVGPLFGMVVILAVRALIDGLEPAPGAQPVVSHILGAVALPGGQLIPLIVLLCAGLVDAAVRRRLFGMIANAEISYGACFASVLIAPGLWSIFTQSPSILWSVAVGPMFLRWRSVTPAVAIWKGASRRMLVQWRLLVFGSVTICGLALIPVVAAAPSVLVLTGSPYGLPVAYVSAHSGTAYLGAWGRQMGYLSQLTAPNPTGAVPDFVYEVNVTNGGVLPITLTGATARITGHALAVRSVRFSPPNSSGNYPTVQLTSVHLGMGASTTVLVNLSPLTCARPHRSGPAMTTVSQIHLSYQLAAGLISHTETMVLPSPLELLCPSDSTPIRHAILMNAG
jgi:hypothetical protein